VKTCVLVALAAGVLLAEGRNEHATRESTKLDATWAVTSVLRNNNELPADRLIDLQIVFRDGRFSIKQGDKTLTTGTFSVDTAKTPHAIDLTTSERDGSKMTTLAIYVLADGVLRICGAQPGEPRPGEFSAMDGSGHTLTTCERATP
jgi:uncharacterized protein (TIGR03067 family)